MTFFYHPEELLCQESITYFYPAPKMIAKKARRFSQSLMICRQILQLLYNQGEEYRSYSPQFHYNCTSCSAGTSENPSWTLLSVRTQAPLYYWKVCFWLPIRVIQSSSFRRYEWLSGYVPLSDVMTFKRHSCAVIGLFQSNIWHSSQGYHEQPWLKKVIPPASLIS